SLGRIRDLHVLPRLPLLRADALQQPEGVAEEGLTSSTRGRRVLAVEDDGARDPAGEGAVPVERDGVVGIQVIPGLSPGSQLVDRAELPGQDLSQRAGKLRQRLAIRRRKPSEYDEAVLTHPRPEVRRTDRAELRTQLPCRDLQVEGQE